MNLVAFLGSDSENWGQITALIKRSPWDKVVLVKDIGVKGFPEFGAEVVQISSADPLLELKDDLIKKLKEKIGKDFEVALSIASGSGKEHMALISALLSIPVGIRLVAFTKSGMEFIN